MWHQWMNGILGLWIVSVPFLNLSQTASMWTLSVSGLAIAALGFFGGMQQQDMVGHHQTRMKHA